MSSSASDPAEDLDRLTALVGRALVPDAEPAAQPLPFAMKLRDTIVATRQNRPVYVAHQGKVMEELF